MTNGLIGRQKEIYLLEQMLASKQPELAVVYGRRRVGKTYLINQFFSKNCHFLEIIGGKNDKTIIQLSRFSSQIKSAFYDLKNKDIKSWEDAFNELQYQIEKFFKKNPNKKVVLFFDEAPWLDGQKSGFLSALEYFWNRFASRTHANPLKIIICGSSASWIIKKIIEDRGGFHNRITRRIILHPFNFLETEEFLKSKQIFWERKQIVDAYLCLGGIPKYLEEIKHGFSAAQNIEKICFDSEGFLSNEFDRLFSSLFDNHDKHVSLIKALANNVTGLVKSDLLDKAKLIDNGAATQILKDLENAGFILGLPQFGHKTKSRIYRLIDEFSYFHLKWLENLPKSYRTSGWLKLINSGSGRVWKGYAFENACYRHISQIHKALGIEGVATNTYSWWHKDAQVDLVIDRADSVINLIEIKYFENELPCSKELSDSLNKKRELFRRHSKTKKAILNVIVTPHKVKTNQYYFAAIDKEINIDQLFVAN